MHKIGVFVCHCGTNIAATVDPASVAESLRQEPEVAFATDYPYLCSQAGQTLLQNAIREHQLTGVVICSCSPRMHESTFRTAAQEAGLNPYLVEVANLREQCSWIHKEKQQATDKAIALAKAALAKVTRNVPLTPTFSPVTRRALVIGGGIAGMQTALDLAQAGIPVDLVERKPTIGGTMAQLDKTFPTLDCAACILTPKMVDCVRHPNITIYAYSEVVKVTGFVGNFTVTLKKKARFVDETKCTGCGLCTQKCPVKNIPNEFNMGLDFRSAISIPFAQAVPKAAWIDPQACRMLTEQKCGLCQKLCTAGAIDYTQQDQEFDVSYGAIVAATGFVPMALDRFGEFGYGSSKDVITSLELERITNAAGPTGGVLRRPSDGKRPKTVVFVSCAGSRDTSGRGKEYCSKICCMYTAKQAMLIREKYPDTNVFVFYIDVRTPGKGFDEFQRRAVEEFNVEYIKGMVGKVCPRPDGKLTVFASNLLANEQLELNADLVVLAAAMEPSKGARHLATMLTASMDTNDFFTEAHPKLRPVESPTAGIFLSGACQGPRDIPETVAQAGAAAAKVIGLLSQESLLCDPCVAKADSSLCSGCSNCEKVCPYGAIAYETEDRTNRRIAKVNSAICRGCGACTVACPSGAMDLLGFSNHQIMAEVDAVCQ